MSRESFDLNAISVESPCTVSWGAMTGDDRTRFCRQCRLSVFNIEGMTRVEAEALLMEREGRVCVRFVRRADGTILTRDCGPVRAARARRMMAMAAAGAMVLLTQTVLWFSRRDPHEEVTDGLWAVNKARKTFLYERSGMVKSTLDWVERAITPPPQHIAGAMMPKGRVVLPGSTPVNAPTSAPAGTGN